MRTGCERICAGLREDAATLALHTAMEHLDLSHTRAEDEDLIAILGLLPGLKSLEVNFCAALGDDALDALPSTIESVEALGCERLSWSRVERLRVQLGRDEHGGERVRCDDSAVLSIGSAKPGTDVAASLMAMLAEYRLEEARRG